MAPDLKAIAPAMGTKYSPNLHAWLKARDRKYRGELPSKVYRDAKGTLWIGYKDFPDDCLIGSKLIGVLCNGVKESTAAYFLKLEAVPDFWERYQRDGRCAIDPGHDMGFVGDEGRWSHGEENRTCIWCGNATQVLRRWTETISHEQWISTPTSEAAK